MPSLMLYAYFHRQAVNVAAFAGGEEQRKRRGSEVAPSVEMSVGM